MSIVKIFQDKLKVAFKGLAFTILVLTFIVGFSLPVSAEVINVDANSVTFEPAQIEVQPGDIIHFEIKKSPPHNVVFDSRGESNLSQLSHKEMVMSGGFDVVIPEDTKSGTYQYWCDPHQGAGMIGKVIVRG
ncbi:MAG: plastocyanin/azurin family copper-binding protein [Cyanobacteria bacterium P01_F01_bin.53]